MRSRVSKGIIGANSKRRGREVYVCFPASSLCVLSPRSEGILSGRAVIVGLKLAVHIVGHQINIFRTVHICGFVQYGTKGDGSGTSRLLLSRISVFPPQPWCPGYCLNGVHLEIVLNSVCCVDPSLDVYFNSAETLFLLDISAVSAEEISKKGVFCQF